MNYLIPNDGFYRVAAAVPAVRPADVEYNTDRIIEMIKAAAGKGVRLIVFPEMCITGYTCADLFNQELLAAKSMEALYRILEEIRELGIIAVVGLPVRIDNRLYNGAAVVSDFVHGITLKTHIPNYAEFYERRWFAPASDAKRGFIHVNDAFTDDDIPVGNNIIYKDYINSGEGSEVRFGVEICEDLWVPNPPSTRMTMAGADIILNLSASDETIGKHRYLRGLVAQQSASCRCGYVYASAGQGESSTDLVFSGNGIIAEDGRILAESPRFKREEILEIADIDVQQLRADRQKNNTFSDDNAEPCRETAAIFPFGYEYEYPENLLRDVSPTPFVPASKEHLDENCEEITDIQSWGLEQRLLATGCKRLVIGISGGLDSTLALLVACRAFDRLGFDRKGIFGITMPGEATTSRTKNNATTLMEELGITHMEIPIGKAVAQHFEDIGQDPAKHDAAYENSQARERTQILMDMANKVGGMVLGTGDLSELALGWCTYNGDHMSMYGINASVPKTLVKYLVSWYAESSDNPEVRRTLLDIVDTPISPELIPAENDDEIAQRTEDLIGPYELHDFYLYHTLRYGSRPRKIFRLALKAFEGKYDEATLKKWLVNFYRRFFSQQFKRSCMPDGPKVGSVCLSPRGDWRMPSDASAKLWLAEASEL